MCKLIYNKTSKEEVHTVAASVFNKLRILFVSKHLASADHKIMYKNDFLRFVYAE